MMEEGNNFERAIRLVQGTYLPHPGGELLMCFLNESVDNDRAARYLLRVCETSENETAGLSAVLSRWKRLVATFIQIQPRSQIHDKKLINRIRARDAVCFLTGRKDSQLDPLIVTTIFPSITRDIDDNLREIFVAFFSPAYEEWLGSHLDSAESQELSHSNLWLVRSSAAQAFSLGFFQVRIDGNTADISPTLISAPKCPRIVQEAADRRIKFPGNVATTTAYPDPIALDILARLAEPIRWVCLGGLFSPSNATTQPPTSYSTSKAFLWLSFIQAVCGNCLLALWLVFPTAIRIMVYRALASMGARIYGRSNSFKVQRLPLGMYLKTSPNMWNTSLSNEYETLDLLRRRTDVPVPKPLDIVSDDKDTYLVVSRLPGQLVGYRIDFLSDEKLCNLVRDLQYCLKTMRNLQRDPGVQGTISNTTGQAIYDGRIIAAVEYDESRGEFIGPFSTEDEFNKILRSPHIPDVMHRSGHQIVFTHGDINMRNILVDKNGRLSGIVDWETAGWYPDYWEYTKAYYITKLKWRWLRDVIDATFRDLGDFSDDLDVERKLWWYCW
ncbi:kinase-like protein [Hypoxylon sp. FL0890]|nr:kinase-like protein [Hypoxylon sp. FL0890]